MGILLCSVAGAAVTSGNLRFVAEINPQPNFNPSLNPQMAISQDGRFVYLPSGGGVAAEQRLVSVLVNPGSAVVTGSVSTDPQSAQHAAISPDGGRLALFEAGSADLLEVFGINPLTGTLTALPGGPTALTGNPTTERPVFSRDGKVVYIGSAGQINVVGAEAPLSSTPVQFFPLGGTVKVFHMAVSADNSTLVAAVVDSAGADELVVFDINQTSGVLTERGRFQPGQDLGWGESHNPEVNGNGTRAWVIDLVHNQILTLDTSTLGTFTAPLATTPTADQSFSLTMSRNGRVLANVAAGSVELFVIDAAGTLIPSGRFLPGPGFAPENNAVLSDTGRLGAVCSQSANRLYVFPADAVGVTTMPLGVAGTVPNPRSVVSAFNFRRLVVLNNDDFFSNELAQVFDVEIFEPKLFRVSEIAPPGVTFTSANPVALDPSGVFVHLGTPSDLLLFTTQITGLQTTPLVTHPPTDAQDIVLSASGLVMAAADAGTVLIYSAFTLPTPSATFAAPGGNLAGVRMALNADGTRLYVPNPGSGQVHVLDTTQIGPITPLQTADTGFLTPTAAALSPDETHLLCACAGSDRVVVFDVSASNGTLVNQRDFAPGFDVGPLNNPVSLADNALGLVGDTAGNVHVFDLATAGVTTRNRLALGASVTALTAVPGQNAAVALGPADGRAWLVKSTTSGGLSLFGSLSGLTLADEARAGVPISGSFAAIPLIGPPRGVALMDLNRPGDASAPAAIDVTGSTAQLATDLRGTYIASVDTTNSRAWVHRVAAGAPPRLVGAVLIENAGNIDGVGQQGEALLLTFDRPVLPLVATVAPSDFFLLDGGSIGDNALVAPASTDLSKVLLTLGSSPSNIVVAGTVQGIDLDASVAGSLFMSLFDSTPASDLGVPGVNDAGVDLRQTLGSVSALIDPGAGGGITIPQDPDYQFAGHRLEIPAGGLTQSATFSMGPPPIDFLDLGLPNVVLISTDAPDPQNLFTTPATLTLEYDPTAVDVESGQLEYLVQIVQIVDMGGQLTPVPIPGGFEVDTATRTVSGQISSLDPTGLGAAAATRLGAGSGGVGVFATLPVNPVEERTIFVKPGTGAAAAAGAATDATLLSGSGGAYTLHQIEFPGFVETTPSDPLRTEVTIRSANLFERTSFDATSFPAQSGAVFTVETRNASGALAAFGGPANLTIEFIERASDAETDTVDFSSVRGEASKMRAVGDVVDGSGVDFQHVGGTADSGVVHLEGVTPLTGVSGTSTFGAVIDNSAVSVTADEIVNHILGSAEIGAGDPKFAAADQVAPFGVIDVADLVTLINSP